MHSLFIVKRHVEYLDTVICVRYLRRGKRQFVVYQHCSITLTLSRLSVVVEKVIRRRKNFFEHFVIGFKLIRN